MSVSAAELPELARETALGPEGSARLRTRIDRGLERIAFFVVPSAVAFLFLGDVLGGLLFQTGRFDAADTRWLWYLLVGSAVGLVAGTLGRLYASAFYALQDARTPLAFASLRVVLSAVLAYVSVRYGPGWFGVPVEIGAVGITATTGFAAWLEYLLLRRALARRIGRTGIPVRQLLWFWGSALAAGGLALLGKTWMTARVGPAPRADPLLGVAGAARAGAEPDPRRRAAHPGVRRGVPGSHRARRSVPAAECPLPAAALTERSAPVAISRRPPLPPGGGCAKTRGPHVGASRPPARGAARSIEVSDDQKGPDKGFGPRKPRATFGDVMLGIPAGRGGDQQDRPKGNRRREESCVRCRGRDVRLRARPPRAAQAGAPQAPGPDGGRAPGERGHRDPGGRGAWRRRRRPRQRPRAPHRPRPSRLRLRLRLPRPRPTPRRLRAARSTRRCPRTSPSPRCSRRR